MRQVIDITLNADHVVPRVGVAHGPHGPKLVKLLGTPIDMVILPWGIVESNHTHISCIPRLWVYKIWKICHFPDFFWNFEAGEK